MRMEPDTMPQGGKLLILDLDETLVHASERELERPADFRLVGYHVYLRPHLQAFLDYAFAHFTVGVWTSSGQLYAEPLVDRLMPGRPLAFLWSAPRCSTARDWETGGYTSQKRLGKLKRHGFRLEQMIGIDDTPGKYARNYGNLVAVREFTGDPADDELAHLQLYLEWLRQQPNVRAVEKRRWRERLQA
ncbi:HAD family hydrolase [Stenotrophomonas muris]|jgi:TFIIF-interacting CTD phosphatase-like protein|uniref:HAD family hydrolase n=2 Tax=Lysobacteraceae TaxID=32033 RepID=UPI002E79C790|nr:HAD family hydrolase [Stenotrophomonas muris]